MRGILTALLVTMLFAACGQPDSTEPPGRTVPAPKMQVEKVEYDPTVPVQKAQDIGDVEQRVRIAGTLADHERENPRVAVRELITPHDVFTLSTITVHPPFPEELWVEFSVTTPENWEENPVVLHTTVLREEEPIGDFYTMLGEHAQRDTHPERGEWLDRNLEVNALEGLEEVPETLLLVAEARAHLMPIGTREEGLDPLTAEAPEDRRTVVISNPVRINFVSEE